MSCFQIEKKKEKKTNNFSAFAFNGARNNCALNNLFKGEIYVICFLLNNFYVIAIYKQCIRYHKLNTHTHTHTRGTM